MPDRCKPVAQDTINVRWASLPQTETKNELKTTEEEGCVPTRSLRRIQVKTMRDRRPEKQPGRRRLEAPPHVRQ